MSERYCRHTADVREKGVCKSFSDWIFKCEDSRKLFLCIDETLEWITLRLFQITKPVLFLVMHLISYIQKGVLL